MLSKTIFVRTIHSNMIWYDKCCYLWYRYVCYCTIEWYDIMWHRYLIRYYLYYQNGHTALILAVAKGQYDMVKVLLEAEADLETNDNVSRGMSMSMCLSLCFIVSSLYLLDCSYNMILCMSWWYYHYHYFYYCSVSFISSSYNI